LTSTETSTETEYVWPFERANPLDPPPVFAERRASCPISKVSTWNGDQAWLLTRYRDIRAALTAPGISSDLTLEGFPEPSATVAAARGGQKNFARMDPPVHDEHRRMLAPDFKIHHVAELRGYMSDLVDDLLDRMAARGGPVDLIEMLAQPVPSSVICRILDLPTERSDFFSDRVRTWMSLDNPPEVAQQANEDILGYFTDVVQERIADPGDDLISRMITAQVNQGKLDPAELLHMLQLLLVGGFDTTANMIALGTLTLLQHPDQLALLKADPGLVNSAVEELLRYLSVAHQVAFRLALDDIDLGTQCIHAGDGVIAPIAAANRDPEVFAEPDKLDITRDARNHVAFGFGLHQCLGQPLARLELQVVFSKIFVRFPSLRLAVDAGELVFRNSIIYGVAELPVTW
jgi:cytochrome P450